MASKTKIIGDIGVAVVTEKFLKHGINVLFPFDDNSPYDLVIYVHNRFYKIQVKTTERILKNGSIMKFDVTKSNPYSKIDPKYIENEVDYFAFYCIENDWCGLLDFKEYKPNLSFRLKEPMSQQIKNIRYAEQYNIENQIINYFDKTNIKNSITHNEEKYQKNKYQPKKKKMCPVCQKNMMYSQSKMCKECYLKTVKSNKEKAVNNKVICPICNKNYKTKRAKMCLECKNKNIPTKKDLENLLYNKTFDEICQIYKKQASTIRKWYQKYNLPYTKIEINNLYNNRAS